MTSPRKLSSLSAWAILILNGKNPLNFYASGVTLVSRRFFPASIVNKLTSHGWIDTFNLNFLNLISPRQIDSFKLDFSYESRDLARRRSSVKIRDSPVRLAPP
jgi:hypothetical protein